MQFEGLEESPNIIYLGAAPNQQILPAIDYMVGIQAQAPPFPDRLRLRLPADGQRHHSRRTAKYPEVKIVGEKYVPFGSTEMSEVIQAIGDSKPDLILNTINGDGNSAFLPRAAPGAGIRAEYTPVLSFSIGENDCAACRRQPSAITPPGAISRASSGRKTEQFVRKFRARFGPQRVSPIPMETTYFGIHLWAQAVQAAGSIEPSAIRQAIQGRSFDAPEGKVRIDPIPTTPGASSAWADR